MELFEQFIQERVYLKGVSSKTGISHQCAFKAFPGATERTNDIMQRIIELWARGISPIGSIAACGMSEQRLQRLPDRCSYASVGGVIAAEKHGALLNDIQ
jgi:hypothetical protein